MKSAPVVTPSLQGSRRGPFRLCLALLATAAVTVLKGALTTSTGSGMAYPDWPLSDGQVMPASSYTTLPGFFEHFHRVAASATGLLALGLALWLHFGRLGSPRARAMRCARSTSATTTSPSCSTPAARPASRKARC